MAAASEGPTRPWAPAGPVGADSGLRLLIGGALHRQLRWSPDPDAPDSRPLRDGEVRLAIRWIELTAHDLLPRAPSTGFASRRTSAHWQPVAAIGCAELVESRWQGLTPGCWLLGPLHVGTHRVLRLVSTDAEGCMAPEPADDRQLRYRWIPQLPSRCHASGPDAVEQAVRALRNRPDGGDRSVRLSLSGGAGPRAPRSPS